MSVYLFIACGGALGAVARYWLAGSVQSWTETSFPWGILAVNVLGCLSIGVLAGFFSATWMAREEIRLGLVVGFLGGFTTFSAFGYETFALFADGAWWPGLLNVVGSNMAGLLAVFVGYRLAMAWQAG